MEHPSVDATTDDLLANVLFQGKAIFFSENSQLGHEECQRLWNQKIARMTSTLSPQPSTSQVCSPGFDTLADQQTMARSRSMPLKKRRVV